jgi:autotransporter strand-loop-strand O-heptosyltransferase
MYNNTTKIKNIKQISSLKININFIDGAFCEIISKVKDNKKYKVIFTDTASGDIIHEDIIGSNMWVRTSRKYFTDWKIEILNPDNDSKYFEYKLNLEGKRVYIALESKAIGDTLAWFPYVEEFRKKHNCKVIVSTFQNDWFKSKYKNLIFVNPGEKVHDLHALYRIGWYYNDNDGTVNSTLNPEDFRLYPLQKTSSSILGLDYEEIKPKLSFPLTKTNTKDKFVCIGPHASAHAKYWNYPKGWQTIIDYLIFKGYKVKYISQEELGHGFHDNKLGGKLNVSINKSGKNIPISDRVKDLVNCEMFIGVGSGLSWLSWAVGTPTILISGFSTPETEFSDCERIFTPNNELCSGCFNNHKLDPGDWDWCPEHKGTDRQFECTKSITPSMVIKSINKIINKNEKQN